MHEQTNFPPMDQPATTAEEVTTLNLNERQSPSPLWGEVTRLRAQMQSGARWFYWIAGLSLINSIVAITNSNFGFLAGLGITQFISGLAIGMSESFGNAVTVIAMVLNVTVAAFFVFLGYYANKGHAWAFIIGAVVYALDGLIFLVFGIWFSLAFHAFVLFCLYRGFAANRKLKQVEAEIAAR